MDEFLGIFGFYISLAIVIYCYDRAEASMRKSFKGQFKYILGNVFYSFGKMHMKLGRRIAETKREREIRMAHDVLERYNNMIFFAYFDNSYGYNKEKTNESLRKRIDLDEVNSALDILGRSYEWWEQVETKLYYWGILVSLSRYKIDYRQNIKYIRSSKQNRLDSINSVSLVKEALQYFNISENDWIEYGDAVVIMKNIDCGTDIQYIAQFVLLNTSDYNDSIELVQYRDLQSNDYKNWDTRR
jgi:hypothetical protein